MEAMKRILSTKVGRDAYVKQFDEDPDEVVQKSALFTIPNEVFAPEEKKESIMSKIFANMIDLR